MTGDQLPNDTENLPMGFFESLLAAFHFTKFPQLCLIDKMYSISIWGFALAFLGNGFLPYGYYILLRAVVCVICIYYFLQIRVLADKQYPRYVVIGLLGMTALYNPIFLVHLGSPFIWLIVNFATLGFLAYARQFVFLGMAR